MAGPVDTLREHLDVLAGIDARIPGGVGRITAADDSDVVELIAAAQAVARSAQGILALAAGEVEHRSAGRGTQDSLARRLGERSARGLVASRAGIGFGEATRMVQVGEAIRPSTALSGEPLPADREHIASAVLDGRLSLHLARLVDETVDQVRHRLGPGEEQALEQALVAQAVSARFSVQDFTSHCRTVVAALDPDGAKPRDEALRAKASVRETRLENGMLRIVAELDPERAAFYLAAMRARTNPRRGDGGPDRLQPTEAQTKVDAFVSILRDSLKADEGSQGGVDTTILVRIDYDALVSGLGSAAVDGVETPISAAAARRLAAEADLIPQVLGGRSQLLDQGEARRTFTKAQRYAIYAAYLGCAFPHCDIPLAMTEIHHLGSWATRHSHRHGTDLANGIPLCGFHNRLMEQGWSVAFDDDDERVPWFTPPPHVDPLQRPIPGGNLVARSAAA